MLILQVSLEHSSSEPYEPPHATSYKADPASPDKDRPKNLVRYE